MKNKKNTKKLHRLMDIKKLLNKLKKENFTDLEIKRNKKEKVNK